MHIAEQSVSAYLPTDTFKCAHDHDYLQYILHYLLRYHQPPLSSSHSCTFPILFRESSVRCCFLSFLLYYFVANQVHVYSGHT